MAEIRVEDVFGNTSCYETCQIGHQCFGGWLNEEEVCDQEVARVEQALKQVTDMKKVEFIPRNRVGLAFRCSLKVDEDTTREFGVGIKEGKIEQV